MILEEFRVKYTVPRIEKAKKAGKGSKPTHDPHGKEGPHYHPNVPEPKNWTPGRANPHDHYYYPKGKK